jgi:hypothetical protein
MTVFGAAGTLLAPSSGCPYLESNGRRSKLRLYHNVPMAMITLSLVCGFKLQGEL